MRVTRLEPSLTRPCRLRTIEVEWITAAFLRQPHWGTRETAEKREFVDYPIHQ
jgi:hypothetical protein